MKEFTYVIKDELGIHARPAGLLAKLAKRYQSSIEIKKDGRGVQASQLLMLMGLGVKNGEQVEIAISGEDEKEAYEEVKDFFEKNL